MPLQFDLNSREAASILDKSQKTVLRWAKEGRLSYMTVKTPNRDYYRFNSDEVKDLYQNNGVNPDFEKEVVKPKIETKPVVNPERLEQALLSKIEGTSYRLERLERILTDREFTKPYQNQSQSSSDHILRRATELREDNLSLQSKLSSERSFSWVLSILIFILLIEVVIYWLS